MARGTEAKANLLKRFATAVGADYICEQDKKYYFWSNENGERVQVAVTMAVPKTPIVCNSPGGDLDFSEETPKIEPMTEDEEATLARLREELGL